MKRKLKTSDGKDIIVGMPVEFLLDHKVVQGVVMSIVDHLVILRQQLDSSQAAFVRFADEIKSVDE